MMTPARVRELPRARCVDPVELRRICELERLVPPTRAESAECLAAWMNCDPGWVRVFLLWARVERREFLVALWPRLSAFGPDERDIIAEVALEARVAAADGPAPLVVSFADGSVVVADLAGGATHRFVAGVARRPWWAWWLR